MAHSRSLQSLQDQTSKAAQMRSALEDVMAEYQEEMDQRVTSLHEQVKEQQITLEVRGTSLRGGRGMLEAAVTLPDHP